MRRRVCRKVDTTKPSLVKMLINVLPIVCRSSEFVLFCNALLCVHSSFAIILKREKKAGCFAITVLYMYFTINVLWLFLAVLFVGLQCVNVEFPNYTHLLFN